MQHPLKNEAPHAVLHVDLDGASHIYNAHGWAYNYPDDPLFESGMIALLDFLQRNELKATLFTIADDLEDQRKCELLREAVAQGHEIASHSLTHPFIYNLTREEKRVEIAESREKIEASLGTNVRGFRAPNYQVDRDCIELLEEYGYDYDSSTFPTQDWADRLGIQRMSQAPFRPFIDRSVIEFPLPKYKPAPFPFHPSYSLMLGYRYFRWGLHRYWKTGLPLVLLFHLTDFSDPLPSDRLPGFRSRMYTLSHRSSASKVDSCKSMLEKVQEMYEITDTGSLLIRQAEKTPGETIEPIILSGSTE